MSVKHNAYYVAARLEARGPALEKAMADELFTQAGKVTALMRREAPKFQSVLVGTIKPEKIEPMAWLIAPGTDYAEAVHAGVKPGKGLPRYSDPEAGDIIAWLEKTPFKGFGPVRPFTAPRRNSKAALQHNLELRDRYQGLSWHVRHFGTKANPFVKRTHEAMAGTVVAALKAAALKALGDNNSGTALA